MTAIVTDAFRIKNAKDFIKSINDASTSLYAAIGKVTPWIEDSTPPVPTTDLVNSTYTLWDDLFAAKKIQSDGAMHVVPRYDFVPGDDTYFAYAPNDNLLFTKKFYTVVEDGGKIKVYKCIKRGSGPVQIKPTHTTTVCPVEADEYIWKFMYEIPASIWLGFATDDYIPVFNIEGNVSAGDCGGEVPVPPGGHGADNISELGAYSVSVTCRFSYDEAGELSIKNDFRKVALIDSPLEFNGTPGVADTGDSYVGDVAQDDIANLATVFVVTSVYGDLVPDSIIEGPSGTARVVGYDVAHDKLHVQLLTGSFGDTDVIELDDNSAGCTITSIIPPVLSKNSGQTLYIENRRPVSRNGDQTEIITVIVEF